MAREWYERERRRSGWAVGKGGGRRKERTAGNDARTDVEKKRMEKYQDRYSTRKKEQRCPEEEEEEVEEG